MITISIAQTLKPVDDTRAYEKISCSLAAEKRYEVNIIGFPSKNLEKKQKIKYYQHPLFHRLSWTRLFLNFRVYFLFKLQKPDLILVNTPELLPASIIYKWIFKTKIIYDIRDNHALNIASQKNYNKLITSFLSYFVRKTESLMARWVDHITLAEKCYLNELHFLKYKPHTVLENKLVYDEPDILPGERDPNTLLFTGNLSKTSGVIRTIDFFEKLKSRLPKLKLVIIGHAPIQDFYNSLRTKIDSIPDIQLIGGSEQVQHREILKWIKKAQAGVISYDINRSNQFKMPTKVYEYLGLGLPFFSEVNAHWTNNTIKYAHCKPIDFSRFDVEETVHTFYELSEHKYEMVKEAYWKEEAKTLIDIISNLSSY